MITTLRLAATVFREVIHMLKPSFLASTFTHVESTSGKLCWGAGSGRVEFAFDFTVQAFSFITIAGIYK